MSYSSFIVELIEGLVLLILFFLFIVIPLILTIFFGYSSNPRYWWCDTFHRKYQTRLGVFNEFSITCSKCKREEIEYHYAD